MKPWPFNLPGPAFLLFYALLAVAVIVVARWWVRRSEMPTGAKIPRMTDPYAIAVLREGPDEAVRVAVLSLVDRGLLIPEGKDLRAQASASDLAKRPLEVAVLRFFERGATSPEDLYDDPQVEAATKQLRGTLAKDGLLHIPAEGTVSNRRGVLWTAGLFLAAVAWLRSGSGNPIVFLWFLLFGGIIALAVLNAKRGTELGRQTLEHLKTLLGRVFINRTKLTPGGATSEVTLLAAVFGVDKLPARFQGAAFGLTTKRRKKSDSSSSCGSSCGSSSSNGSSGGDGGGCGGGGGCG